MVGDQGVMLSGVRAYFISEILSYLFCLGSKGQGEFGKSLVSRC